MKKLFYVLLLLLLTSIFYQCSLLENDDLTPIEKEREEINESLYSYQVLVWKYIKMLHKATYVNENIYPELLPIKEKLGNIENAVAVFREGKSPKNLSGLDYVTFYNDLLEKKNFIEETDEDVLPSFLEFKDGKPKQKFTEEEKAQIKTTEHFLLSGMTMFVSKLGKDISLYEMMQVKMELIPESELKCLYRLFRGMLFFQKGMVYMTEEEFTQNITWLENNEDADFTNYYFYLKGKQFSQPQAYQVSLSMNYLLRGIDRLLIGEEDKEKAGLEDFQKFLNIMNQLGVQSELTLAIETYLHLKNEDSEKAIVSLLKLKESNMLSKKEKNTIDESITYLKDRKSGKVLNTVYDKYFLGKIITKYTWNVLSELNWKQFLKQQGFDNADQFFEKIDTSKEFIQNIEKYTSEEAMKEAGKQLKEEGEKLWGKAKQVWDEN
ncbi:hypothetical protein U8527_00775 [Kordia algicida OT-1]|uniref:Uncharacterized protein n=1 Tax=Kordia algicida OT-1 TaxID=391587 RepID=A9DRQ0_9FLAO|nr:hypothetical protein [Kordia algicida]EDP96826.1 hypothetical protein KAOT1_16723 [Kordia algicida OT-1]